MKYQKIPALLIVLFIIVSMSGCAARGTSGDATVGTNGITGTTGGTRGTGTAAPTTAAPGTPAGAGTSERIRPRIADRKEDDVWITKKVIEELGRANLSDFSSIEVDSDNRVVTLEGEVANSEEQDRAISIARAVPTVTNVVSKLQIKQ
jgi:hypothetical protein